MKKFKKILFSFFLSFLALCLTEIYGEMPHEGLPTTQISPTNPENTSEKMEKIEELKKLKESCNELAIIIDALENKLHAEAFLEQQISLAELNELIQKVKNDLETKINSLDRPDKEEIIKILKNKLQNLMKHLEDIELIINPKPLNQDSQVKPIILGIITGAAAILIPTALVMSSWENDELNVPSWQRLKQHLVS